MGYGDDGHKTAISASPFHMGCTSRLIVKEKVMCRPRHTQTRLEESSTNAMLPFSHGPPSAMTRSFPGTLVPPSSHSSTQLFSHSLDSSPNCNHHPQVYASTFRRCIWSNIPQSSRSGWRFHHHLESYFLGSATLDPPPPRTCCRSHRPTCQVVTMERDPVSSS
jgi:hypothetical protein